MADKTITVTQVRSPIGRQSDQRRTLVALKLNKMHRTATVADTPSNRGRINKVAHLVRVEEQNA
jgi:large subunit ribosomal protein L30